MIYTMQPCQQCPQSKSKPPNAQVRPLAAWFELCGSAMLSSHKQPSRHEVTFSANGNVGIRSRPFVDRSELSIATRREQIFHSTFRMQQKHFVSMTLIECIESFVRLHPRRLTNLYTSDPNMDLPRTQSRSFRTLPSSWLSFVQARNGNRPMHHFKTCHSTCRNWNMLYRAHLAPKVWHLVHVQECW